MHKQYRTKREGDDWVTTIENVSDEWDQPDYFLVSVLFLMEILAILFSWIGSLFQRKEE